MQVLTLCSLSNKRIIIKEFPLGVAMEAFKSCQYIIVLQQFTHLKQTHKVSDKQVPYIVYNMNLTLNQLNVTGREVHY